MQNTLNKLVEVQGVGLHTGAPVHMRLVPAPAHHGIVFVRTDKAGVEIPALWSHVTDTRLCTVLEDPATGVRVGTVEHLMAALAGLGVDNVCIEIDGPEVPVMDGSSAAFVEAIDSVGLSAQRAPRRYIRVLRPIQVKDGDKIAMLTPADVASFACSIDFSHPIVGLQDAALTLAPAAFRSEIANARTFGFLEEVVALQAAGLALGGSLDNAIVVQESGVLNPEGLRMPDEFARHKLLDAIGDMALAGAPLLASYTAQRPSHALNNALLSALFEQSDAWSVVEEGAKACMSPALLLCTPKPNRTRKVA